MQVVIKGGWVAKFLFVKICQRFFQSQPMLPRQELTVTIQQKGGCSDSLDERTLR